MIHSSELADTPPEHFNGICDVLSVSRLTGVCSVCLSISTFPHSENAIALTYLSDRGGGGGGWLVSLQLYFLWTKVNVRSDMKAIWLVFALPIFLFSSPPLFLWDCLTVPQVFVHWPDSKIPSKYRFMLVLKGRNNTSNKQTIKKNRSKLSTDESPRKACWHLTRFVSPWLTFSGLYLYLNSQCNI